MGDEVGLYSGNKLRVRGVVKFRFCLYRSGKFLPKYWNGWWIADDNGPFRQLDNAIRLDDVRTGA